MPNNRIYDPKTDTYAYYDGSGVITAEQVTQRKLLLSEIKQAEVEQPQAKGYRAGLIFKFLTFFSK